MGITVILPRSVSEQEFEHVVDLVRRLQTSDPNFTGRTMRVRRGFVIAVEDTDDDLRGALLRLMVEGLLRLPAAPPT